MVPHMVYKQRVGRQKKKTLNEQPRCHYFTAGTWQLPFSEVNFSRAVCGA